MILAGLVSLLSVLLVGSESPPAPEESVRVTTIEERLIIRVPVVPRPRQRLHIRWEEEKGPKCLPAEGIARAFLSGPDSIDFLMRGRQLIRARLDSDCDGLDFYGGFYVQPEDHRICARRDTIRSPGRRILPHRALPHPRAQGRPLGLLEPLSLLPSRSSKAARRCRMLAMCSSFVAGLTASLSPSSKRVIFPDSSSLSNARSRSRSSAQFSVLTCFSRLCAQHSAGARP